MNVVVVVIDTLRQDHLELYGYGRQNAPFMTRLGKGGAVMDGLSTSSWTKPATASLLTGLHPLRHQAFGRTDSLPLEATTLAEILKAEGYQTSGISANRYVSEKFGFAQGFEQLRVVKRSGADSHANSQVLNRVLLPAVNKLRAPFFLYVHYIDPHYPYAPGRAWDGTELDSRLALQRALTLNDLHPSLVRKRDPQMLVDVVDLYDGEIRQVDGALEALFRELDKNGKLKNTLFVIASDHGEEFEDHGMMSHGQTLYEEVTRIPLIFYAPGLVLPGSRDGTAILEDVLPTVLALLSISTESNDRKLGPLDGISLAPVLTRQGATIGDRGVLLHLDYVEPTPVSQGIARTALAFVDRGRKLLFTRFPFRKELFELNADPGESRNLLANVPASDHANELKNRLMQNYHSLSRGSLKRRTAEVDVEMRESLHALGYLSGNSTGEIRSIPRRIGSIDLSPDGAFGWERLSTQSCISPSQLSAQENLLEGWHYPDSNGRWTMKSAGFQILNGKAGDAVLRVEGANWNTAPVDLSISTRDGPPVMVSVPPGQLKVEARMTAIPAGPIRFQFDVDTTFSPADAGESDVRELGVFIRKICLEPAA